VWSSYSALAKPGSYPLKFAEVNYRETDYNIFVSKSCWVERFDSKKKKKVSFFDSQILRNSYELKFCVSIFYVCVQVLPN